MKMGPEGSWESMGVLLQEPKRETLGARSRVEVVRSCALPANFQMVEPEDLLRVQLWHWEKGEGSQGQV